MKTKHTSMPKMEIHMGEDYAAGYIGEDAVFTRIYPSERIERQWEEIAGRYNAHDELVLQAELLLDLAEFDCLDERSNEWRRRMVDLRTALAKARGEV